MSLKVQAGKTKLIFFITCIRQFFFTHLWIKLYVRERDRERESERERETERERKIEKEIKGRQVLL